MRLSRSAHDANLTLNESLPLAAVPSQALVGFEFAYPDQISPAAPLSLRWDLPASGQWEEDTFVYVVLRPLTAAQAAQWTAPALMREGTAKNLTCGAAPCAGGTNSTNANTTASAPASAPSASALRLDFSGLFGIGLLAPLLLIGVATFLYRRMKAAQEQKEA